MLLHFLLRDSAEPVVACTEWPVQHICLEADSEQLTYETNLTGTGLCTYSESAEAMLQHCGVVLIISPLQ